MSVYNDILEAVVTEITALGLTDWNNDVVPVSSGKLPTAEERLDSLPRIVVSPKDQPESIEQGSLEGHMYVGYPIEIVCIAAGNRDFTSHLDTYFTWRERIRRAFQAPSLPGVDSVWDTEINPQLVIDRSLVNDNYDYGGLTILFKTVEQRGN